MLNIFRRSLRTGVVTTTYPETPDPAPPSYRGQVQLDTARCAGHAACASACPSAAISVTPTSDGWIWRLDDARCVFCGLCQEACPTQAITLSNEFELAVRAPDQLITSVSFTRSTKEQPQ